MERLKGGFIIASILILFFGGLTFMIPRKVSLVKTAQIFSPMGNVYREINDLLKWSDWMINPDDQGTKIHQIDENNAELMDGDKRLLSIKRLFSGQDSSVFLVQTEKGSPITLDFRIDSANTNLTELDLVVSTQLKWYPWDRIRSIFYDKVMGGNFQEIVGRIKIVCEEAGK